MSEERARAEKAESALSSVDNALWLISLVATRRVLRVADAARELGVARSTAHRLLNTLKSRGFVSQEKPNAAYRPGSALLELGLAALGRTDIRRSARPVMDRLSQTTQETVSLAVLDGNSVRILDAAEGPLPVRVASRIGIVIPAHCSAAGKALLAALPEEELHRRYPDQELEGRTAASITDWDILVAELNQIRAVGYAVSRGENETILSAVAMVIRDAIDYPIAAIALVVPSSRFDSSMTIEQCVAALQKSADAIHDLLSTQPPAE